MKTQQYEALKQAYTTANLTQICSQLLLLYRQKQYDCLRAVLRIADTFEANIATDRQLLSKLMMRYHPDRLSYYHHILEDNKENSEKLSEISHILEVQNAGELFGYEAFRKAGRVPADAEPSWEEYQYQWEDEEIPVSIWGVSDDMEDLYYGEEGNTFFNVLKRSVYGRQDIELPVSLLEDIDELELADRGMESLEGVEYFHQLKRLDISGNLLTNLEGMEGLAEMEEIYAADNQIGYIDALSNLEQLRIIDLSGNNIDDVSALMNLPHLEFVNIIDNPVPGYQIKKLKDTGCLVSH